MDKLLQLEIDMHELKQRLIGLEACIQKVMFSADYAKELVTHTQIIRDGLIDRIEKLEHDKYLYSLDCLVHSIFEKLDKGQSDGATYDDIKEMIEDYIRVNENGM